VKKIFYTVIAAIFIFAFLAGCGNSGIKVEKVKITNDLNATFDIQARVTRAAYDGEDGDFGIVGNIKNGQLNIDISKPDEIFLHVIEDLNFSSSVQGMRVGELWISAPEGTVRLENSQSGDSIAIWGANKDGVVKFRSAEVSLKKGWNFIESSMLDGNPDARVYTSLNDVYKKGSYTWVLIDFNGRRAIDIPASDSTSSNTQSTPSQQQPASQPQQSDVLLSRVEVNRNRYSTYDQNNQRITYINIPNTEFIGVGSDFFCILGNNGLTFYTYNPRCIKISQLSQGNATAAEVKDDVIYIQVGSGPGARVNAYDKNFKRLD